MGVLQRSTRAPFASVAPKIGFVGGLDGIRGVLILLVMLEHANVGKFRSVTGGVDIFYVISGFLITSLLFQEHRSNGSISLRKFYSRRALRLLPSVWLMLATVTAIVAVIPEARRKLLGGLLKEVAAAFFYVYHLVYPVGFNLFHDLGTKRVYLLVQLWSLSVEEQFYLVIALGAILFIARDWVKPLVVVLTGFVVFVGVSRWLGHPGPRTLWIQRPDNLAVGMLLAVANARLTEERAERWRRPLLAAGTIGMVITAGAMLAGSVAVWKVTHKVLGQPATVPAGFRTDDGTIRSQGWSTFFWPMTNFEAGVVTKESHWLPPSQHILFWWQWGHSVIGLAVAPAVLCMARYKDWLVNRWLSFHPFRFLGRMSYTIYVWHGFFFMVLEYTLKDSAPKLVIEALQFTVGLSISLAVYFLVEQRVLRWKLRYSSEREVVDLTTGKMVMVDGTGRDATITGQPESVPEQP